MPALAAHATLAVDDGFRRRMQAALVQLAVSVANNTAAPSDQRRLASEILDSPAGFVDRYAWPVAGANTILSALSAAGGNPTLIPDKPIEDEVLAAMQRVLAARAAG